MIRYGEQLSYFIFLPFFSYHQWLFSLRVTLDLFFLPFLLETTFLSCPLNSISMCSNFLLFDWKSIQNFWWDFQLGRWLYAGWTVHINFCKVMGGSTEEPALAPSVSVQRDSQCKKSLCFAPGRSREVRYHRTGAKSEDDNIPKQCHSLDCVINRPITKQCLNFSLTVQNCKRKQLEEQCDAWYHSGLLQTFRLYAGVQTEMLTYQLFCVWLLRTKNYCLNNPGHCSFSYQIQHLGNINLYQFFQ